MQSACRLCPPPPNRCSGMKSACRLNPGGEQSAGSGMQAPCPPWPYAIRMQEVRTRSTAESEGAAACRRGKQGMQSARMWGALCRPPKGVQPHAVGMHVGRSVSIAATMHAAAPCRWSALCRYVHRPNAVHQVELPSEIYLNCLEGYFMLASLRRLSALHDQQMPRQTMHVPSERCGSVALDTLPEPSRANFLRIYNSWTKPSATARGSARL